MLQRRIYYPLKGNKVVGRRAVGKKKKSKKKEEEYELFWKGIEIKPIPEDYKIIDGYPIREGYAEVVIATPPGTTPEPTYFVKEVQLEPHEIKALEMLKDMLSKELEPPKPGEEEDVKKILIETADKLLKKYRGVFGQISEDSKSKLFYYLERDMMGFGPLNVIMEDYRIEDVSCDGVNVPVYVWHRDYESMPTNIMFTDREVLDDFIIQLAHKSGKHISSAFPILDAMIYGKHRLAATFREEVSPRGSTFTIRKFREKPFSIIELLESNLMSPEMAAYFWILLEHKANIMIAGATGSGKTTLLNALACFIKPRMKIVTCEETAELNLPTENWVRFVTRESYGLGTTKTGQITLFDLVRTSLRYRPDYLIVGEVRGEEAFVLFQSIASVSWDTPVLIRDVRSGKIELVKIGEFVDRFYDDLEERVPKYVDGFEVLTLSCDYRLCWKPIRYVLRHKTDKVYRIRYIGGEVRATGSHSVFILDEDTLEVKAKRVNELKPGDILVGFLNRFEDESLNPRVDLIDLLGDPKKDFVDGIPSELKVRLGRNPISLSLYLKHEVSKEPRKGLRIKRWYNGKWIPATIEIDEDVAFLLGVYLADGCVKEHRGKSVCFSLGAGEEEIRRKTIEIVKKKFDLTPTIEDRGSYSLVTFNSTILAELFEKLVGKNLEEKHVPSFLWHAPKRIIRAFLDGYRADSRRNVKDRRDIHYTTKKRELACEISWLARISGLNSYLVKEKHKKYGVYHGVYVSSLGEGIRPPNADVIPVKPIYRLRENLNPSSMPWRFTRVFRSGRRFVSREIAKQVLNWILNKRRNDIKAEDAKLLKRLRILLKSDVAPAPVLKVEEERYDQYVYDISVPGSEAFYGGCTPILLHNTGHGGISTIHAESVESAIKRLVSPPMNIPPSHISLLDALILIERVYLPKPFKGRAFGRRVRSIWEVADYGRYITIAEWDPLSDTFRTDFPASIILDRIALRLGKSKEDVLEELWRRKAVLEWMMRNNVIELKDVANVIYSYYTAPEKFLEEHGIKVVAAAPSVGFKGEVLASWSPIPKASPPVRKPVEEVEVKGVEDAVNYVMELLSMSDGSIPYWQIFAKASIPKDLIVKALLKLRSEGRIEVSEGLIKLKES